MPISGGAHVLAALRGVHGEGDIAGAVADGGGHGFDILARVHLVRDVGLAEGMKRPFRMAEALLDTVESVLNGSVRQRAAVLTGEHKAVVILPRIACVEPVGVLAAALVPEELHHIRWKDVHAAFVVLCGVLQGALDVALLALQLARDVHLPGFQVDIAPL